MKLEELESKNIEMAKRLLKLARKNMRNKGFVEKAEEILHRPIPVK